LIVSAQVFGDRAAFQLRLGLTSIELLNLSVDSSANCPFFLAERKPPLLPSAKILKAAWLHSWMAAWLLVC
jgi:hypothetical protein|tara:strand:+ start:407 stop:619 length:213 start_codon:yes stop_codon:yes gene_type:complete